MLCAASVDDWWLDTGLLHGIARRKAIWVCTAAIENTVNQHLDHQVAVLSVADPEALAAVESIRRDEEEHEEHAVKNGGESRGLYRVLRWLVQGSTGLAIWLSTKL